MIDFPFDAVPTTTPAAHSRYVQRVRRRYADEIARFAQTAPGTPRTPQITALIAHLREQGRELGSALRVARHLVMERLACLDVEAGAPMLEVTASVTELAEVTLDHAMAAAEAELAGKKITLDQKKAPPHPKFAL